MVIIYWIAILTIVRVTNSDTVDPKDKLSVELSNVKDQLDGMQGDTDSLKKSLDAFSKDLEEGDESFIAGTLEKANSIVLGVSLAIPKFKSGETDQIISGILDMTSMALATFGGPHGAAAAVLVNIVSSLIGLFMTTPESSPTVDQMMAQVLNEFQDKQDLHKMRSFISTLKKVHNGILAARKFSKEIEGRDLTDEQITQLKTEIDLFATGTHLENVKQGIADEIENGKVPDAERALKTLNVYCKLNIVVELVLVEFINYIKEEGPEENKLPPFYHSFMTTTRNTDKEYLGFLHFPELKEALVAAIYQHSPSKYPELRDYIKAIEVSPIPKTGLVEGKTIYLTPKKWPDWHFYLSSKHSSLIYGSESTDSQSKFVLRKAHSGVEGREWRLENVHYPKHFISARKFDSCMPLKHPAEVEHVEGLTMEYVYDVGVNCRNQCGFDCGGCYSNCYTYFKGGNIYGKVSINSIWRFTKLKSSGRTPYFFISAKEPQFGPGYTLFMQDSGNGNAYLKYGNPKEMGMFKLTE